jgi:undecaprenyl-diphosphatase
MLIGYVLIETDYINKIRNVETIAWTTLIFGILLYFSDKFKLDKTIEKNLSYKSIIFIGCLQIFSLIPGVSRSGIAITAARFLNFKRVDSAKISFLLSIPILAAVSIFGLKNIVISSNFNFTKINLIAIFLSFLFSLVTIKFFLDFIKKFDLKVFVYYRVLLGVILLILAYL